MRELCSHNYFSRSSPLVCYSSTEAEDTRHASNCSSPPLRLRKENRSDTSGGAEVVGASRTTLLLGSLMVNKTPNNVVGYFMIFVVFSFLIMGIILDWVFYC